jgi:hypothetical protein
MLLGTGPLPLSADEPTEEARVARVDTIAAEVEALRGWSFKTRVETEVNTEEELRAFLLEKLEEEYPGTRMEDTETFLVTIGALANETDLAATITKVLLNQVGGFYDPARGAFFMIEREGVDYGPAVEGMLLAHELTHALDDQYVDLDSLLHARERTEDGEFVVGCLVEGSATALMTRYMTQAQMSGKMTMADLTSLMESESERSAIFLESPRYFQTMLAQYTCGMMFLYKGNLLGLMGATPGNTEGEAFLAALADPPRSSEQILHPEKYWNPATRDDPVTFDDDAVETLLAPLGVEIAAVNTAGEILTAVATTPPGTELDMMASSAPGYWTNEAATGWDGDRFYLLRDAGGDEAGAVWITVWDTPADRDEFVATYEATVAGGMGTTWLAGERVAVFSYGGADEAARGIRDALQEEETALLR